MGLISWQGLGSARLSGHRSSISIYKRHCYISVIDLKEICCTSITNWRGCNVKLLITEDQFITKWGRPLIQSTHCVVCYSFNPRKSQRCLWHHPSVVTKGVDAPPVVQQ